METTIILCSLSFLFGVFLSCVYRIIYIENRVRQTLKEVLTLSSNLWRVEMWWHQHLDNTYSISWRSPDRDLILDHSEALEYSELIKKSQRYNLSVDEISTKPFNVKERMPVSFLE